MWGVGGGGGMGGAGRGGEREGGGGRGWGGEGCAAPSLCHSLTPHSHSFIHASLPPLPVPDLCGVGRKVPPPPSFDTSSTHGQSTVVSPLSKPYVFRGLGAHGLHGLRPLRSTLKPKCFCTSADPHHSTDGNRSKTKGISILLDGKGHLSGLLDGFSECSDPSEVL